MRKKKLNYEEQIEDLKRRGITFNDFTEEEALHYLKYNNNLFKLSSYRKNYNKQLYNKAQYIHLDFGELVDLATIDMYLRRIILQMALDIEHFAKVALLRRISTNPLEDGYAIVSDYIKSLTPTQFDHLQSELKRNAQSPYCHNAYQKYKDDMPVWVFIEIISFGSFISFYKYCAERFRTNDCESGNKVLERDDKHMLDNFYLMLSVKQVRNASAHNNCILNDLKDKTLIARKRTSWVLNREIAKLGTGSTSRIKKISNIRISQILSCFLVYHRVVTSEEVSRKIALTLHTWVNRLYQKHDFSKNLVIKTTFNLFKSSIDNWFPLL